MLARKLEYGLGEAVLAMEIRFRTANGEPTELTVARHRADLFSLSYNVPNDALRSIGEGMKREALRSTRMDTGGKIIIA